MEFWLGAHEFINGLIEGADFFFEDFDHALDGAKDELFAVLEAVFLAGELLDEVPPTIEKGGEFGAGFGGSFHGA